MARVESSLLDISTCLNQLEQRYSDAVNHLASKQSNAGFQVSGAIESCYIELVDSEQWEDSTVYCSTAGEALNTMVGEPKLEL